MSTPQSWSGGSRRQVDMSRRQADKVRWSWKVTEMGQGTDKGGKRQERKEGRSYHDSKSYLTVLIVKCYPQWHPGSPVVTYLKTFNLLKDEKSKQVYLVQTF